MRICLPLRRLIKSQISIIPIFLPFFGCPQKCIFCAQHSQTGVAPSDIEAALRQVRCHLDERLRCGAPPVELGFFGGTFTFMPASVMQKCIDLVLKYRHLGAVVSARCSTRPDALSPAVLHQLKEGGFSTIELGIQSFNTQSLLQARRGYTGQEALSGCRMVRDSGLQLGVQLLPGMPGVSPDIFVNDVSTALASGAQLLRFYPCLVIFGTLLAQMWKDRMFMPWELDTTLTALAEGYTLAAVQGVPVIRMGLAPEASLQGQILAGPEHPALGARVQALALIQAADEALQGRIAHKAEVAHDCQGFFWGHQGELRQRWEHLGVVPSTIQWQKHLEPDVQCVLHV